MSTKTRCMEKNMNKIVQSKRKYILNQSLWSELLAAENMQTSKETFGKPNMLIIMQYMYIQLCSYDYTPLAEYANNFN